MRGRFRFSSLENLFWKTSKVKLSLHSINTVLKKKEHWHQKIQRNFNKLDGNCSAHFSIRFTQFRFHCTWMVIQMCLTPGSPYKWLTESNRTKQADALDYKKDLIPKVKSETTALFLFRRLSSPVHKFPHFVWQVFSVVRRRIGRKGGE